MKDTRIIKGKKQRAAPPLDQKKESLIKELSLLAEQTGFNVRREHLKQGLGWKVVSGSCRANEKHIIFVDRKLSQSDQITFLIGKFLSLNIQPSAEHMAVISDEAKDLLTAVNTSYSLIAANV